jgi:protein O-GlcNAc transferase
MVTRLHIPVRDAVGLAAENLHAGRLAEAELLFRQILDADPECFDALYGLGIVEDLNGRHEEAIGRLRRAVELDPSHARALACLGAAELNSGRLDAARACLERALVLDPELAEAHSGLARIFVAKGETAEALVEFQDALLLDPKLPEAHFGLGALLQAQGMLDDARESFRAALSLYPDFVEARWRLAMSQLPAVYATDDEPERCRSAFSAALKELDAWFDSSRIAEGYRGVGVQQPFYLAYQERDNRPLLSDYGDLCARLMRHWQDAQGISLLAPARTGPVRVGIVSAHIHDQSVWNAITRGWCRHLDRGAFSLHIFQVAGPEDAETAYARSRAAFFLRGARDLRQWVDAIVGQRLDAIVYPEIGMDAMTVKLASMRLAPVQAVAWGHPETSGLPTIDHFLSAEDFEPDGARNNYRENLVVLPHLGCSCQPLEATPRHVDAEALGIEAGGPLFLCPGFPFKYLPANDWIFVEIARRLGACRFVFFNHVYENLSDALEQRLAAAFERADLHFPLYGTFIPRLSRPDFHGLMRQADVCLDTLGFSGFNTAIQAVECGLPLVTREGRYLRGRLASGVLKRLGLTELVAPSDSDYVELAVKLAQDAGYRERIRGRLAASRQALYDDVAPVRALEDFLRAATRTGT